MSSMNNSRKRDFTHYNTPLISNTSKGIDTKPASKKSWAEIETDMYEESRSNYCHISYKTKEQKMDEQIQKAIELTPANFQDEHIPTRKDYDQCHDSLSSVDYESSSQILNNNAYNEAYEKLQSVASNKGSFEEVCNKGSEKWMDKYRQIQRHM